MTFPLQKVQLAQPTRRPFAEWVLEGATLVDRFNSPNGKELEDELLQEPPSAIFPANQTTSGHGDCERFRAACRGVSV